jgi:hypothetical protein
VFTSATVPVERERADAFLAAFLLVPSLFRDPVVLTFVDEDDHRLAEIRNPAVVPRVGENVRLSGTPYVVLRIGYDVPADDVTAIWVICHPA